MLNCGKVSANIFMEIDVNLENAQNLIQKGESNTLELKKSTAQIKAIGQTLCAFLNGNGGVVIIGVNDKGKIIGQHVTDNTLREVANMLKSLEPFPAVDAEYLPLPDSDKHIILMAAPICVISQQQHE